MGASVSYSQARTKPADSTQARPPAGAKRDSLPADSTSVQGAIFRRPFIGAAGSASIGGYMEANANYLVTDGITDGFSTEMRRFNIFLFAPVGPRLRFTSELEFEHGTEEIALETALLDFQVTTAFVLRAGILLAPIGGFNQNHDGPRWEFIERPLAATEIIPSTLSEVGFGAQGRLFAGSASFTYDAYLTNGLNDGVILNESGRTRLASGKRGEQLEEDNNGSPAFSARVAMQQPTLGEVGVSYYGGIYNTFRSDGETFDDARRVALWAVDGSSELPRGISVRGEVAMATVQLPPSLNEVQASKQWGGFVDVAVPLFKPRMSALNDAIVTASLRLEYVDFNVGTFSATGGRIHDEMHGATFGLSFRPSRSTVFKTNYVRQRTRDALGNRPSATGGFRIGVATYF